MAVTASYAEEVSELLALGCINMYNDVGSGFVELTITEKNNSASAASHS